MSSEAGKTVLGVTMHKHNQFNNRFSLQFAKPSRVDLVGSFLLKTLVQSNLNVDVIVELPQVVPSWTPRHAS